MYSYSIMPLDTENLKERCDDIRFQYEQGITDCVLFSMPLVPEGNPPIDKTRLLGEKYKMFRDELSKSGLKCGILVQASLGHGYVLNQEFPFQKYVNLTDGKECYVVCPYDTEFREYFKTVMRDLACLNPAVIMVDDDFRLTPRPGRGCACPLHLAEFNKRAGTRFTRDELYDNIKKDGDIYDEYREIFDAIQKESLVETAKAFREGIDSVDPSIQGAICTCGSAPVGEIARALAGKGNPSIIRFGNGNYTAPGARNITWAFARAAMQRSLKCNEADIYLAETDTCPQNRYSTSASFLHNHYTGTILEGASGAKHWITRTIAYEPESGKAYRDILSKYSGFYKSLFEIVKEIRWTGCRIPMPSKCKYRIEQEVTSINWATDVLERFGFPMYFSPDEGGAVFLNGDDISNFTESELENFFKGTVILASDTAKILETKGFGKYLGVSLRPWIGDVPSGEIIKINGHKCSSQMGMMEIVPLNDRVEELSYVYHLRDGKDIIKLFPGSCLFKNPLGGTTVVFAGTPKTRFVFSEAFSFLNESRKKELVDILENTNNLPIYYPGDAEIYLKAGYQPDNTLVVAFFNLGLDYIESLTLSTKIAVTNAQVLLPNGDRMDVPFKKEGNEYIFNVSAQTLIPVILFLK